MSTFSTLSQAIASQLKTLTAMNGVALIQEDIGDVPTMIEKELGRVGMGVLLGVPEFTNQDKLANMINAIIHVQILFMEVPALWRKSGNEIHCADLAQISAAALQGLVVTGFEPLRVLSGTPVVDKDVAMQLYRLEIETMQIFAASN